MHRQRIISVLISFLLLLIGGYTYHTLKSKKKSSLSTEIQATPLRIVEANRFPPTQTQNIIPIDGRALAVQKINIESEVQGRLLPTLKLYKEGTEFSKGDLLFNIEGKDDSYRLKSERSTLYNTITQALPELKLEYPEAHPRWKAYVDKFDINKPISRLPKSTSKKEKYFIGRQTIPSQYYNIKSLEEQIKSYSIYAPFDGVFLKIDSYPGSLISPGKSLGEIMMTDHFEVTAPVALEDIRYIDLGQKVKLKSEELGQSFDGKVSRTSKQIDPITQNLPVYIKVNGDGLRDGMYLNGHIKGQDLKSISILPKSSIIDNDKVLIYLDSTLVSQKIRIHKQYGDQVYISGLDGTEAVITSETNKLYPGQRVLLSELVGEQYKISSQADESNLEQEAQNLSKYKAPAKAVKINQITEYEFDSEMAIDSDTDYDYYTLTLGSFGVRQNVLKYKKQLEGLGLNPYIDKAGKLWRINIGRYQDKTELASLEKTIESLNLDFYRRKNKAKN